MARASRVNPKTGLRFDFEEEQRAKKAAAGPSDAEIAKSLALLKRQQRIIEARDDLMAFTQYTMPDPADPNDPMKSSYEAAKFHIEVAHALEAVERGEIQQLIFAMPPRHGKTQLATKSFAAWLSGRHPTWNLAVASYSDTMAEDMGADTRAIMASQQFKQVFRDHALRRGGTAKANIQTVQGGRAVFVGRGGALTGRGADCLLIDDLYKDHEEARSQTIRDQAWNWFTKVAMTRRMGRKLVIITMTRWHSDDIIGRITDPENPCYNAIEAAKWKIIRLPAIAEDEDPLGRAEGEVLWPERFDLDFMQSQQRLDPLGFAALYQQSPTVADGVLFRRENMQFYKAGDLPDDLRIYCSSDHAVATGQRNDYTVMFKIGIDRQSNIWVLDCFRAKVSADKAVEAMLAMAAGKERPLLWWAERGHISKSIGPFLRKRMLETGTYINVVEVTPVQDKEQRAQSIAARIAMGKVYFPADKVWTEKIVNELLAFPSGIHDDAVDALAYIGLGLQSQFAPGRNTAMSKQNAQPKTGTLAWIKLADKWAAEKRAAAAAGGF